MDSQHQSDTNNHPLKIGIDAAKAGNRLLARLNLEQVATATPDNATCWLWLAWTADSPAAARLSSGRAYVTGAPTSNDEAMRVVWK